MTARTHAPPESRVVRVQATGDEFDSL